MFGLSEESGMFNGLFGKVANGMCRLSMDGKIAIKTENGYKTYSDGKITNCSSFVFDIGEEFFFVIPTNHVEQGDIILVNSDGGRRPMFVLTADGEEIKAIDYKSSEVKTILPEHHVFMGETYFYGKIVSMFGNTNFLKGKKGMNKMIQLMMLSSMTKGGSMSEMLPFMMMSGNMGNMFEGMFDFGEEEEE